MKTCDEVNMHYLLFLKVNKPILISKTLNNYNLEINCEAMIFERGGGV